MSRALTALIVAAGILGGFHRASADHLPPPHYEDALYEDYDPYLEARHRGYRDYDGYRRYDRYRGRRYDYDGYYRPVPPYYDEYYRGYDDYYPEGPPLRGRGADSYPERARGFDPRRPHLGDGTDAPSEQYYPYRPRSCGEYYYWDGTACVDARKHPPYVGPKQ